MSHVLLQDYIVDMNIALFFRPVGLHIISSNYLVFRIAYHLYMRTIKIFNYSGIMDLGTRYHCWYHTVCW